MEGSGDQSLPYKDRSATPTATADKAPLEARAGSRFLARQRDLYSFHDGLS